MNQQPTEAGPILFMGQTIRAILAGTKTMTRRIVKDEWQLLPLENPDYQREVLAKAPFQPGTRRWCQETHTVTSCALDTFGGVETWHLAGYYDADLVPFTVKITGREARLFTARKKKLATVPGRFMYRSLSRITLEIEAVKCERVKDISEEDARAEGAAVQVSFNPKQHAPTAREETSGSHRMGFANLWDSINLGHGHGWEANDWCWCVSFRRTLPIT